MGLFAKNRPTKRIDLSEDKSDWVELQFLSKGIKDELKNEAAAALKDFKVNAKDGKPKEEDGDITINGDVLKKLKEVEIRQMVAGIAKWSEDAPVTFENVKALSDEPYEKILEAIVEMNELKEEEVKN